MEDWRIQEKTALEENILITSFAGKISLCKIAGGLENRRIKIQQEKIALLEWPEDWRIGGFRKKMALLKWPEDWRIQEFFRRKNNPF